jgi:hypothetical protein
MIQVTVEAVGPPSPLEDIQTAERELGTVFPDPLRSAWLNRGSLRLDGDWQIYGATDIVERNQTFEIQEYAPHLLLIGDDGGGRGLLIERSVKNPQVMCIDLGAVGSDDGSSLGYLSDVLAGRFLDLREDQKHVGFVDIVLVHPPRGGLASLVKIAKRLGLQKSITDLKAMLDDLPAVLLSKVRVVKYEAAVNDLNVTYGGLAILQSDSDS